MQGFEMLWGVDPGCSVLQTYFMITWVMGCICSPQMILEYQLPEVSGISDQERISCCYLYYVSNFAEFLKDRSKRGQSDIAGGRKGGETESLLRHDPWMPPDVLPVGGIGCITDKVVVRLRALASHSYVFPSFKKYILSTYYMRETVLGFGDSAVNKKDLISSFVELTV